MRREWSPWIKTRRWGEFERLAKSEPSQPLADTVAELERGFPEKEDRRALRKVLFLLGQAGYRPQAVEDAPAAKAAAPRSEVAFMLSPTDEGKQTFGVGKCEKGKTTWLYVDVVLGKGLTDAVEQEEHSDDPRPRMEKFFREELLGRVGGFVPPVFVRARIADEVRRTRGNLPSAMAFWRTYLELDSLSVTDHPADHGKRSDSLPNVGEIFDKHGLICIWRLELGIASAYLREHGPSGNVSRHAKAMIQTASPILFTPDVAESRVRGLLDMAYLCRISGRPGADDLLRLADDVRENGPESEYAALTTLDTFYALKEFFDDLAGREQS